MASWSPDGKQLVAETTCGKHPPALCIYDVATGEARFLAWGYSPLWSPDGKQIAFGLNSQVCVIKVDGSDQRCLTEKQENNIITLHSWSPTGNRMLFSRAFSPDPNGNDFRFEFDTFILDVQSASVKRWFEGGMIKR
jgi:Tol biopolymer transport system component